MCGIFRKSRTFGAQSPFGSNGRAGDAICKLVTGPGSPRSPFGPCGPATGIGTWSSCTSVICPDHRVKQTRRDDVPNVTRIAGGRKLVIVLNAVELSISHRENLVEEFLRGGEEGRGLASRGCEPRIYSDSPRIAVAVTGDRTKNRRRRGRRPGQTMTGKNFDVCYQADDRSESPSTGSRYVIYLHSTRYLYPRDCDRRRRIRNVPLIFR